MLNHDSYLLWENEGQSKMTSRVYCYAHLNDTLNDFKTFLQLLQVDLLACF